MHPIELTVETIANLGMLIGIGILLNTLIKSFKDTWKRLIKSMATWLTVVTILSCILAISFKNFFYGFPAVPLVIPALAVLFISRRLMIATVYRKSIWISLLIVLLLGIWSFCIYLRIIITIIPDYPTLNDMQTQVHWGYGVMLIGFAVWEMIFSIAINLGVAIKETKRQRIES